MFVPTDIDVGIKSNRDEKLLLLMFYLGCIYTLLNTSNILKANFMVGGVNARRRQLILQHLVQAINCESELFNEHEYEHFRAG